MKITSFATLTAVLHASVTVAQTLPSGTTPELTISQTKLDSVLICPKRANKSYRDIINPLLLVPGTGTSGAESWDNSFAKVAPWLGFDPCYISPEPFMLDDTMKSAQYFVNAVRRLTAESGKSAIPVITWSQGGLVSQVALTFYPNIRCKVDRVIAFAPDYRGTNLVPSLLAGTQIVRLPPSVWQQAEGSQLTTALKNAGGLTAIVPTTNIYSSTDEIVQPSDGTILATGYLTGATNVLAQDFCQGISIFHAGFLYSEFSFSIAKYALLSKSKVWDPLAFAWSYCGGYVAKGLSLFDKDAIQGVLLADLMRMTSGAYGSACEPVLPSFARIYADDPPVCFPLGLVGRR
ncbi:hypothetical protein V8E36_008602 [Tilletia maclaganii]